jgi:glycosyltransferase involved in cell wall biosynthesis
MSPEAGVLVPPGDSTALAGALIELLKDENRRRSLGEGARKRALERYAWDGLAGRLVRIYEEVLTAR